MPKKLHKINNYTDGYHFGKSQAIDTPDQSKIRGFASMRNLDPCVEVGSLRAMSSPKVAGIPRSTYGTLETINSAGDNTYVTNLLSFGSDYDYAHPSSGSYTSVLTQNYSTVTTTAPVLSCIFQAEDSLMYEWRVSDYGNKNIRFMVVIESNGQYAFTTDPSVTGTGESRAPVNGMEVFGNENEPIIHDLMNDLNTQMASYDMATQSNVLNDLDVGTDNFNPAGSLDMVGGTTYADDYGTSEGGQVNWDILVWGHFYWMHPDPANGEYDFDEALKWHGVEDWWDGNPAHPEYYDNYINYGVSPHERTYWSTFAFYYTFHLSSLIYSTVGGIGGYLPQIVDCEVIAPNDVTDALVYRTKIDGVNYDYTTSASDISSEAICDGIVSLIDAITDMTAVKTSNDPHEPAKYRITGPADGTGFTYTTEMLTSSSASYVSTENGTDYLAVADGVQGSVHLLNSITNVWTYDAMTMDIQNIGTNVHLSYIQNAIRACDTSFLFDNFAKWHGYVNRSYFGTSQEGGEGNTSFQITRSAWHFSNCALDAVPVTAIAFNSTPTGPSTSSPISVKVTQVSASGNWDGDYDIAVSTLYDDIKQESLLAGITSITTSTDRVGFEFYCHVNDWYSTTNKLRVSGFRIYARKDGSNRWYLQAEVSMGQGIKTIEEDTYTQWADSNYVSNVAQCISATGSDSMGRMESYEVLTGHSSDLPAVSFDTAKTGWVASAYVNGRCYYGNIRIKDINGDTKRMSDAMVRSEVGKPDVVCADNLVTIIEDDGESIRELIGLGNKLLQFKEDTLYVIDTSSGYEILEKKYERMGVRCQHAIAKVPDGIVWINKHGLWQYTVNGGVRDLTLDKNGISRIDKAGLLSFSLSVGKQCYATYDAKSEWIYFLYSSNHHYGWAYHRLFGTIINIHPYLYGSSSETYTDGDDEYWMNTWSNSVNYKGKDIFANNISAGNTPGIKFGEHNNGYPICNAIQLFTGDLSLGDTMAKKKIKKYLVRWRNPSDWQSGLRLSHTENGSYIENIAFTVDDAWDGSQLSSTSNTITNSGFETQGASAPYASGWTLTANTNGTSMQRTADDTASEGSWVVKDIQSSSATSGTAGIIINSTGFNINLVSLNYFAFHIKIIMDTGEITKEVFETHMGKILLSTPTGSSGGSTLYWNGSAYAWQTGVYSGEDWKDMPGYQNLFAVNPVDNILYLRQDMWIQLVYNVGGGVGVGFDHDVTDATLKLTMPKVDSCSMYINDIAQVNWVVSTQAINAELDPLTFSADSNGDIYSTSMRLQPPVQGTRIFNWGLPYLKIFDIGILYRDRKIK